jgi:hypothetical protein
LRITGGKGAFIKALTDSGAIINQSLVSSNTLYSSVQRYLHGTNAKQKNEGNAYEVYRALLAERHYDNIPPAPEVSADEIADEFKRIKRNTISYIKGGDYLDIQIKFFSKAPSLSSLNTIKVTLTDVLNSINSYLNTQNANTLSQELKGIFTKELGSAATEIENEAI